MAFGNIKSLALAGGALTVALSLGCTKKTTEVSAAHDADQPYKTLVVGLPAAGSANLVSANEVAPATYKLMTIQTNVELADRKVAVIHRFNTVGMPSSGDPLVHGYDGPALKDKEKDEALNAELSLPLVITSKDGHLTLNQVRYYWNYVSVDKKWGWQLNGKNEAGGNPILAPLSSGTEASKGVFTAATADGVQAKVVLQQQPQTLNVYFEATKGDRTIRGLLTYVKLPLQAADESETSIEVGAPKQ